MSEIFDPLKAFDEGAEHARVQRIATIAQLAHEWAKARKAWLDSDSDLSATMDRLWEAQERLYVTALLPRDGGPTS